MIINGYTMHSRGCKPLSCNTSWPRPTPFPAKSSLPTVKALYGLSEGLKSHCPADLSHRSARVSPSLLLSATSTPLLSGEHGGLFSTIPHKPKRRGPGMAPRASNDVPYSYRFPPMTKKPRWWWRTLACIPYLMPLHEPWIFAKTAYHLHPFLEDLEFFTYPFFKSVGRLPRWYFLIYFITAYLAIVRRKEWPHFFRFHVASGMLLEIGFQAIGFISRWMPRGLYWGKIGMHFWVMMAFGFLFTVLETIRCCLAGMYADIPFVSEAAYIQIPYYN